ncbi:flavin reductase family protein [Brevirhabdus sp.]|uniref:flavin reductase family protein n=1 Tax=Brevirhabdus sp. TaxID=2004514 RepID=UPI004059A03E
MTSFRPGPETKRAFRDALGQFATGVTVVTAATDLGPVAITANSFASVSLDPPLVLWSPAKASARYGHFETAQHYAIHVLSDRQRHLAHSFARSASAFEGCDWTTSHEGVPLLEGCLARFECAQVACHDAGDHIIIVGEVTRATRGRGRPLLFMNGTYGAFQTAEA